MSSERSRHTTHTRLGQTQRGERFRNLHLCDCVYLWKRKRGSESVRGCCIKPLFFSPQSFFVLMSWCLLTSATLPLSLFLNDFQSFLVDKSRNSFHLSLSRLSLSIFKLERTMGGVFLSAFHPSQSFTFSLLCSLLIFLHFSIFTSFLFPLFQFLPHTLFLCFILHSLPLLHHLSPVSIHSSLLFPLLPLVVIIPHLFPHLKLHFLSSVVLINHATR